MNITDLTIRAAISQVKIPNKAVNADSRLTNRYIFSLLRKHRDLLIKQVDNKFQLLKLGYLFQAWKCADLEPVPTIDECCDIKNDCNIYRTRHKLPYTLVASWGPIFRKISSLDGFTEIYPITLSEWNRKQEDTNRKYDKTYYCWWSDGHLYFPNLEWKGVRIEALFEFDLDDDCNEKDHCKSILDNKFRIPKELMAVCVDNVNKEMLGYYERLMPDENEINKNNTRKDG